jgi:hypothetical protein
MTLENMFYISQTVAGFAIVVSLLFVGVEVRHSNLETRHRTIEEMQQNYRDARAVIINHADIARAWLSGLRDLTALDPADRVRFLFIADSLFHNLQGFFLHHRDGRMPEGLYEPQQTLLNDILGYPGLRAAWELRKSYFHAAFRESVNEMIAAAVSSGRVPSLYGEAR